MQAKPLALLFALAFAGVALSGCLEAPSFLFAADSEATAQKNLDLAQEAAKAWSSNATLTSVFAFETAEPESDLPTDPDVGNGRAVAWWYGFAAGNETRAYRVTADGQVALENDTSETGMDADQTLPLGEWTIDSDRALETAKANQTFGAVASGKNVSYAEGIANEEGSTQWFVAAYGESGFVIALVDATTGELTSVESMDFDFGSMWGGAWGGSWGGGMAPEVEMSEAGELDREEPVAEFPFTLTSGGQEARLLIEISKRVPTDALNWKVVDAADEVVAEGSLGRTGFMGDGEETSFVIEDAGDYTLLLFYESRAILALGGVEYEFTFTVGGAPGMDFDWG